MLSIHRSHLILGLSAVAGLFALSSCRSLRHAQHDAPLPAPRSLVILYDNDVHCQIDGYASLAGLRDAIADTAYVHVVSSGDFLSGGTLGALSRGAYIADLMREVGYTAFTFGNHEYDFRSSRLSELLYNGLADQATCANYIDVSTGAPVYHEYIISPAGTHRVAYIGVTTPTTLITMPTAFTDDAGQRLYDLVPTEVYDRVQRAADKARYDGADLVIVLSHLGETPNETGITSHGLIAATRGIDAVLDGHSHSTIPCEWVSNLDGKPVPVSQTGTLFQHIGKLVVMPDGKMEFALLPMSDVQASSAAVASLVSAEHAEADSITSRVVAYSEIDLELKSADGREVSRTGEMVATNVVTDAFRLMTGADITILNAGGIRYPIKAGDVTYGALISMLPYDNRTSVAEITGEMVVRAIELNVTSLPNTSGQFPLVSGMHYTVSASTHEVSHVEILNKETGCYEPVDPARRYTIASTDYAIFNGGLHGALSGAKEIRKAYEGYAETFIAYVTQYLGGRITAERYGKTEGRITVIE